MLDYGKVSVKRHDLPRCVVPGIRHYEAIREETIRLLRKERERRKLSNYVVAQHSGVSESMLSLVERGLRNPTMELMLRIADGIGSDLPAIMQKAIKAVQKKEASASPVRKSRSTRSQR